MADEDLLLSEHKVEIRSSFISFITKLQYLSDVFSYAEEYRAAKVIESTSIIMENPKLDHLEISDRLGKDFIKELSNNLLFFKFTIIGEGYKYTIIGKTISWEA